MYYVVWYEREHEPVRTVFNDEDLGLDPSHRVAAETLLCGGAAGGVISVVRYGESAARRFEITPATRASLKEIG